MTPQQHGALGDLSSLQSVLLIWCNSVVTSSLPSLPQVPSVRLGAPRVLAVNVLAGRLSYSRHLASVFHSFTNMLAV